VRGLEGRRGVHADLQAGNTQRQAFAKEDLSKASAHRPEIPTAHQRLGACFRLEPAAKFRFTNRNPGSGRSAIKGMGRQLKRSSGKGPVPQASKLLHLRNEPAMLRSVSMFIALITPLP